MSTTRRARDKGGRRLWEMLEARTLFDGVTVITHGLELGRGTPAWLTAEGNAIAARIGPKTTVYKLTVGQNGSGDPVVTSFSVKGPSATSAKSPHAESVLLIDWSRDSGIGLIGSSYISTSAIASVVIPFLTTAQPAVGLAAPLAEGAIHLLGHSRGGSLVSEIGRDLGKMGIWVDQLTTLAPVAVASDPQVNLGDNIVFADNYYEQQSLTPSGTVKGAANFGPLTLGGVYNTLGGGTHSDVHLFYDATISPKVKESGKKAPASWFVQNNLPAATSGYYYSRVVGGARAANGVGADFGGGGARNARTRTGPQWANIGALAPGAASVNLGGALSVSFQYEDDGAASTVQWFLDKDNNPYNTNGTAIGTVSLGDTGATVTAGSASLTVAGAAGKYFLEAAISNAASVRYAYTAGTITVTVPPPTAG